MLVLVLGGLSLMGITSEVFAKQGFYLGLAIPYNTIGGDFDGETAFAGASDVIIVPKIDGAFGYGILAGYEANNGLAFELSYQGSKHNAKWMGGTGKVDYSVINLDLKYNFDASESTQPYVLVGINIDTLVVKDGSSTFSGQIGDATYTGAGFNLGAGVNQYVNPNVSIGLGLTYRLVAYDQAEGVVGKGKLDSSLNGDGFGLLLDAAYHF
jgi:opacity protein-like surface antigen